MRSLSAFLGTVTAYHKRYTVSSGVRSGTPITLAQVEVQPLMPLQAELVPDTVLERVPVEALMTFISDPDDALDIRTGDILTVAGKDYTVRYAEKWPWRDGAEWMVVVEDAA